MKISYNTIQSYINEPLPRVDILVEKIIFHAFEVESMETVGDDKILDIKILPDRAGDCKENPEGIAREVAGLFGLTLKDPDFPYEKGVSVVCNPSHISELLGREVMLDEIRKVFDAYHYYYEIDGDSINLFVPPWRKDISSIYEVVDEVGRYAGYDSVPALIPEIGKAPEINYEVATILEKRNELLGKGYNEIMTYSLTKKGDFELAHALKGKDHLRTNLLDGLRASFELNKLNKDLLQNSSPNVFEIGRVFPKVGEELHVAWINEKGEHEEVLVVSPSSDYPLSTINSPLAPFHPWSAFPFITRDIAVWVPEGTESDVLETLYKTESGDLLMKGPTLLDTFSKDGKVSYAYRLVFQSYERTLTEGDIAPIMEAITEKLTNNGFQVR